MLRRLITLFALAFIALLATLGAQAQEAVVTCDGKVALDRTCPTDSHIQVFYKGKLLTEKPAAGWVTECNGVFVDGLCTIDGKPPDPCRNPLYAIHCTSTTQDPIIIAPGPTTLSVPGLKVYTTFLGLPCGDAFPMPGCLPPQMQGWLVQVEGGSEYAAFDVTLIYTDTDGRRHLHTQECVPRSEPYQGKPPFTAVPFAVGRAKSPPWFPAGTTVTRTEVWPSRPGCHEPPQ